MSESSVPRSSRDTDWKRWTLETPPCGALRRQPERGARRVDHARGQEVTPVHARAAAAVTAI